MSVLGPIEVTWNGARLPLKPAGNRLLGYLAYRFGAPVPTVEIVTALWPDVPEATGKNRIRVALSAVRETLASVSAPNAIRSLRGAYELDGSVCGLDVDEFEVHIRTARTLSRTNEKKAARRYRQALDIFVKGSDPYADLLAYDFAVGENRRLSALRAAITADLIELEIRTEPAESLLDEIRLAIEVDPLNERLYAALMIAEYRAGRQSEALRIAEGARDQLASDSGLDTHPFIRRTEERILNQDPTLLGVPEYVPPEALSPVPTYTTKFVGRASEMALLEEWMPGPDPVTVVGPGGSGKTRLVVESLASTDRRVVFVDLTRVRRGSDIRPTVAAALRIGSAPHDLDKGIDEALRKSPPHVILDNCEHVLDHAAAFVRRVGGIPGVKVIATSREPLALEREVLVTLRGLAMGVEPDEGTMSESARLFVDRAHRSGVDLELTDATITNIERICYRRDGLPLAIELAASWVPYLSVDEIDAGLVHHVDVLVGTRRAGSVRAESMEDTLGWSYSLLGDREQLVFRRAALLERGFTIDLLTLVCRELTPQSVRRAHVRLVAHQLIDRTSVRSRSRFSMLQTIKTFGAELAETVDHDIVADALAKWAWELAEDAWVRIDGEDRERLFHVLDDEIGNLMLAARVSIDREDASVALQLVAGLNGYINNRTSLMAETLDLFRRADSLTADGESEDWVRALIGAGLVSYHAGQLEYASELLRRAIRRAKSNDDKLGELNARHSLGRVLVHRAEMAQARATLRKATELSRALGDSTRLARDLSEQGGVEAPEMQLQCLTEAADLIPIQARHVTATYVAAQFAWFNLGVSQAKASAAAFTHALSEYRSRGSEVAVAEMFWGLADCHELAGERSVAVNALREALSVAREAKDGPSVAISALRLSDMLGMPEASELLDEAAEVIKDGDVSLRGRLAISRGRLAFAVADRERAVNWFSSASDMFAERSYPSWVAAALLGSAMATDADHREDTRRFASDAAAQFRASLDGPFLLDGFVFPELGSLHAVHDAIHRLEVLAGLERRAVDPPAGLDGVAAARSALDELLVALT